MPSLPALPPVAVPPAAVQGRSQANDARAPAATDHGATVNAPKTAADGRDSAQDSSDGTVSFESVLEAQMGLRTGPKAPVPVQGADASQTPADAPSKPEDKQQAAADAAAAMLMLPANVVVPQVPAVDAGALAGSALTRDGRQGGKALPVEPGNGNAKAERPGPTAISAAAETTETTASTPANFAATLQSLPATDATPKHPVAESHDISANATEPVLPGSIAAPAERKLEATQPQAQRTETLPGVVGDSRWGEGLSQRVVWMVGQDVHAAKFQVEPPQLGPIEVKVSIANDQATVSFAASHSATRDAIQTALPRLQEMLAESGVSLGNVFVGSHTPQDQRQAMASGGSSRQTQDEIAGVTGAESVGADRSLQLRRVLGLVDLYA